MKQENYKKYILKIYIREKIKNTNTNATSYQ